MRIEHVAIWTNQLERLKAFYEQYFEAKTGPKYRNSVKDFESYFLQFEGGARFELMTRPGLAEREPGERLMAGYAHVSFAVGSKENVDDLTAKLNADGYRVVDGPRTTGDGYYESQVLDPDGNQVEITV